MANTEFVCMDTMFTSSSTSCMLAQVVHTPYRGVLDCVSQVYKQEGLRAFYKSYRTTLVMNVPFITMHFT